VETATSSLTTMKENITNSISNIEQADLIETAAQLTLQQSALSASQSALSAVLQISLFNYL
jgi:flagellin-like hook-associated protein FlgL